MPFKIVRNDITKMNTQAIVNTANEFVEVGTGCDTAIYKAAGYDELLAYRRDNIGNVPQGEVFITPGFNLPAEYIIHAVSPYFVDGSEGEEEKLRSCYRKSLQLAAEHSIRSIAFPLISTGGFGYPKEEGMRIAIDEISAFLIQHDMLVYLVVFGDKMTALGGKIYPDLEEYIDQNYVEKRIDEEYGGFYRPSGSVPSEPKIEKRNTSFRDKLRRPQSASRFEKREDIEDECFDDSEPVLSALDEEMFFGDFHESKLEERLRHRSDTFSQYLLYLIQDKNMENAEVYKRAIVDKKTFSKIKNNVDYHPQKITALCLCVGARLNLDESKDLLARAGYALSPSDMTDIIFTYFIENEIYDMIELDIQLEEHGLPCIIS